MSKLFVEVEITPQDISEIRTNEKLRAALYALKKGEKLRYYTPQADFLFEKTVEHSPKNISYEQFVITKRKVNDSLFGKAPANKKQIFVDEI